VKILLSGNEAIALGAYHAGVKVATAYPGTPSTEILEAVARFPDVYAEWSTNEKVAMEVAMGAAYAGARALCSMKQVGLNVASDPFMAASVTGIQAGLVVANADDPGIHSSQCEQDNRFYAPFAKVPMLEPSDSQEAYDLMAYAFDISEKFDTPVLVRTTTRIAHAKSAVNVSGKRPSPGQASFQHDMGKYVMLPTNARVRCRVVEERSRRLAEYVESFPLNEVVWGKHRLGIVTSGVAYQYAREVFPGASFLKLCMTWPLPANLIQKFADKVAKLIVIEELSPYLEGRIREMGIEVSGKDFIPALGELNPAIIEQAAHKAGLLPKSFPVTPVRLPTDLPKRPPVLCPGCPHSGVFFVLSMLGQRTKGKNPKITVTGDIGCYTLGAYPPLNALDTTACMGASIGQAIGMAKAGVGEKVVAVIGDSTFMHSGITGLVNAVYDKANIALLILDNGTTAMTGHQEHPGTGVTVRGEKTQPVELEKLVRGIGVKDVRVVDAFDLKALRTNLRESLQSPELSVLIVRGPCAVQAERQTPEAVDAALCNDCDTCLLVGCPAILGGDGQVKIDETLCIGCTVCQQLCPRRAIAPESRKAA